MVMYVGSGGSFAEWSPYIQILLRNNGEHPLFFSCQEHLAQSVVYDEGGHAEGDTDSATDTTDDTTGDNTDGDNVDQVRCFVPRILSTST